MNQGCSRTADAATPRKAASQRLSDCHSCSLDAPRRGKRPLGAKPGPGTMLAFFGPAEDATTWRLRRAATLLVWAFTTSGVPTRAAFIFRECGRRISARLFTSSELGGTPGGSRGRTGDGRLAETLVLGHSARAPQQRHFETREDRSRRRWHQIWAEEEGILELTRTRILLSLAPLRLQYTTVEWLEHLNRNERLAKQEGQQLSCGAAGRGGVGAMPRSSRTIARVVRAAALLACLRCALAASGSDGDALAASGSDGRCSKGTPCKNMGTCHLQTGVCSCPLGYGCAHSLLPTMRRTPPPARTLPLLLGHGPVNARSRAGGFLPHCRRSSPRAGGRCARRSCGPRAASPRGRRRRATPWPCAARTGCAPLFVSHCHSVDTQSAQRTHFGSPARSNA